MTDLVIAPDHNSALSARTTASQSVEITPTGGPVGATVTGFDASVPLAAETILALRQAFAEHQVLIFKGQTLTDDEFLRFATCFGGVFQPPEDVPVLASDSQGKPPDVVLVANTEGGYTGSGELSAHSDHHWTPYPSKASLLYALEVPAVGGDTWWSNQYQVYDDLDEELKLRIEGLQLITYNPFVRRLKGGEPRLYRDPVQPPVSEAYPHPLVGTHPETGRRFLYLDAATEVEVCGLGSREGEALIAALREHAAHPQYFYTHQWSVGDVVLWDNLATTHYRPAFNPDFRRVMKRVSLAGGRPF